MVGSKKHGPWVPESARLQRFKTALQGVTMAALHGPSRRSIQTWSERIWRVLGLKLTERCSEACCWVIFILRIYVREYPHIWPNIWY